MQAMKADDLTSRFALDMQALADLRVTARTQPREGLKAAAQQFEAYFLQMVMKSMREAGAQDDLMNSDATRFYTGMLDQQLSQDLSAKSSLGFARLLEQQLGRGLSEGEATSSLPSIQPAPAMQRYLEAAAAAGLPVPHPSALATAPATGRAAIAAAPGDAPEAAMDSDIATPPASVEPAARQELLANPPEPGSPREFVSRVWPHALEAAAQVGVPAHFLVAHAALETGWGRHEPRRADGSPSFNLFGVKAGRSWRGDVVEATTTEFSGGVASQTQERFRAYGSYAESFRDYAALIAGRPRFSSVLGASDGTDFARKLQQAGYATDPMYADKLARIINGGTLRQALMG